jgi:hypothetical protein
VQEILRRRDAGYACVAVETPEEERLTAALLGAVAGPVRRIAAVGGLLDLRTRAVEARASYLDAWAWIASERDGVLIACDYQHVARAPAGYRPLRDALPRIRAMGAYVVLVAPRWDLPPELAREIPVLSWALPTRAQLTRAAEVCLSSAGLPTPTEDVLAAALDAAAGLTLGEAEGAMALALAEHGALDRVTIEREKLARIRASGCLEVAPAATLGDVGGLAHLRRWIADEAIPAADDPDLAIRGILLAGVPGTGKSLAARALGAALRRPVIRLDLAAAKGSLVGESERRIRDALATVEAIAPTVLWIDELEKAVGGYRSSAATDSGVTLGLVGHLLTWLQEHRSAVTTVATANEVDGLPPELLRAGRFDASFFVDLPTIGERREIALVHLRRYAAQGVDIAPLADVIASVSDKWTGAEIEALVRSAARRSRRQIDAATIEAAARGIVPLSRSRAEEIARLREWARDRFRAAGGADVVDSTPTARRIRAGGAS